MSTRTDGDPGNIPPGEDPATDRLRATLHRVAESVEPNPDGLPGIRARIGTTRRTPHRWAMPLLAAAAVVVVGGVSAVAVTQWSGVGEPAGSVTDPAPAAGGTSGRPPEPGPTTSVSPTQARPVPAPAALGSVPVYAVTLSGERSALAREFRSVPARGDRATSAVSAMTGLEPLDPDYRRVWRRASSMTVRSTAGGYTVDLSADAFDGPDPGADLAATAIQQLVWTVTAAGGRDVPVTVLVDGERGFVAWGHVRLGAPMRRDIARRAAVWVDTPQQDGSLPRGGQVITGQGNGFEATFTWTVTSEGRTVDNGFVTGTPAGASYGWWVFRIPVQLPPGEYTVSVESDDPSDGEGNGRSWPDTKVFTVG